MQEGSMKITVGGIKGGSGKTTIATNLAIIRAAEGRDVLLIDADDQETAYDFTQLRAERFNGNPGYTVTKHSGEGVRTAMRQFDSKYQDIIVDTGGRDTAAQRAALTVSDLVIVPFVPRSFDVWTLQKAAAMIQDVKVVNENLEAYTFINRADPRGQYNELSAEVLKDTDTLKFVNFSLGSRIAFGNAAAEGVAVTELKSQDPKATAEMMALYRYIFYKENAEKINSEQAGANA
jgi:chromosome partitioning protein